jgi:hypothetical protein
MDGYPGWVGLGGGKRWFGLPTTADADGTVSNKHEAGLMSDGKNSIVSGSYIIS